MKKLWSKKSFVFAILFVTICAGVTVSYTLSLDAKQKELISQKEQLQEENKLLKAQNKYLEDNKVSEALGNSYENWLKLEESANKIVEHSEGKFKKSWALYLVKEAERMNVDPYIVYELLNIETGGTFDPKLIGPETKFGRAHGLAQFMKNTAPWIADMAGLPYEDELLYDPYYSIELSLTYLDFLHNEYGNWNEALTAYNRGMAGLEMYKTKNGHAESNYAKTIQSNAKSHQSVALK